MNAIAVKLRQEERVFTVKNPSKTFKIPRPNKISHMLQMFIAIEINLEPKENSLDMFQLFLQNLEALKLPSIQYYLTLNNFDDCDDGDGIRYLKSVCKQLPHIDKLVCMKSLLHSHAFCELFRGLKLLIIKDSHIKFTPFAPGDLQ